MPSSSGSTHLPSLEVEGSSSGGTSEGLNGHPSASLRGKYHNKVPEIAAQPLNTLLPIFPDDNSSCTTHPEPYYITQNVVLKVPDSEVPPWISYGGGGRNNADISSVWNTEEKFRQNILEELIKDCLHMEVAGIVSSTLVENKARNREEASIHAWLEDHVVTDSVYIATENIVWEALWNEARKLKKRQIEDLEKHFLGFTTADSSSGAAAAASSTSKVDSHMLNILRENYKQPLNTHNGQSLVNKKWAELLYHTNRYMQRGSLMDNYAIRKLQEQIICQIAAKVVLDESIKCVEQELASIDVEEHMERPPRTVMKSTE
eukprot:10159.XXX_239685_238314_1 [CDS] Oithona nana genome sequencing.